MSDPTGVPSPYAMHVHPYPTRFHGGSWRRPVFGLPYVRQPFNVIRPSQEHVPLHVPQTPPLVNAAGQPIGCVNSTIPGEKGVGVWDTGAGVFRRPKLDGGGIFNAISGLGASLGLSPMTSTFIGAGVLGAGLIAFLMSKPKKMTANKRRTKKSKRRRHRRNPSFKTIADVKQANRDAGKHFFDRDSMKFFNSKIESVVYGGEYFITSEREPGASDRRYTVRRVTDNGSIQTVGEFQGFRHKEDARDEAKRLASSK